MIAKESEPEWQVEEDVFDDEDCQFPHEWPKRNPIIQIIDQEGNVILDFNSLLPDGFSFVIPSSFDRGDAERISFREGWAEDDELKRVYIGEWIKPQQLFPLMHEIGHAYIGTDPRSNSEDPKVVFETMKTGPSWFQFKSQRKNLIEHPDTKQTISSIIQATAFKERASSIWALGAIRKLGKERGINIFEEIGLDRRQLVIFVKDALRSHKKSLAAELSLEPLNEEENEIIDDLINELAREFKIYD